ncbi:MAG TPA: hypothetical protein DD666_00865 [Advenella kashmirensis]|uniref:Uncharacterized protein n=1 Tax=Advenella kashmirensis TaxID=310575 RepID=A0A356LBL1_9BURK|nr:hypothetical protein [Advenella kashmirensis]
MPGTMRLVTGVVAVDSPLDRIRATAADELAAKIDSISVALQSETLINNGQNQICGRESAWGAPLTTVGTNTNWYQVLETSTLNNQPSIEVRANGNGIRVAPRPTGQPLPASFMIIIPCSFTADAVANTTGAAMLVNSVPSANNAIKVSARRTGANFIFTPNQAAASTMLSTPMSGFTADAPHLIGLHWNNQTHTARIYRDDLDSPLAENTNTSVSSSVAQGDHWDFLYGGDGNVGAIFGNYPRAYIFDAALMDDPFTRTQVRSLWATLKTFYGIA